MRNPQRYIVNEQGSVLPVTMLTMLIVTVMATTAMYMSFSDYQLTTREVQRSQARALSEAAIAKAMAQIREDVDNGTYDTTAVPKSPADSLGTGEYSYSINSATSGITTEYTINATGTSKSRTANNMVELELVRLDNQGLPKYSILAGQTLRFDNDGTGAGVMLRSGTYFANDGIEATAGSKLHPKQDVILATPEDANLGDLHGGGVGGHAPTIQDDANSPTPATMELPELDVEELTNRLKADGYSVEYHDDGITLDDNTSEWQARHGYAQTNGGISAEPIVIIVNGDVDIEAGADIGRPDKPVLLITSGGGTVTIGAQAHIYGLIYSAGDIKVIDNGNGLTKIEGILISKGNVDIEGSARIWDGKDAEENLGYFNQLFSSLPTIFDLNITSWEEQ